MNRRDVITGAACATTACVIGDRVFAGSDTPIVALYRKSRALIRQAEAATPENGTAEQDAELERLYYSRAERIEAEMMALPCTCAADFAAKMISATAEGANQLDWQTDPLWAEARSLIG